MLVSYLVCSISTDIFRLTSSSSKLGLLLKTGCQKKLIYIFSSVTVACSETHTLITVFKSAQYPLTT